MADEWRATKKKAGATAFRVVSKRGNASGSQQETTEEEAATKIAVSTAVAELTYY